MSFKEQYLLVHIKRLRVSNTLVDIIFSLREEKIKEMSKSSDLCACL